MDVKEGLVIKLKNGREYRVSGLILDDGKAYLYLVRVRDDKDEKIVLYEDDTIYPVDDEVLYTKLLKIVAERKRPKE